MGIFLKAGEEDEMRAARKWGRANDISRSALFARDAASASLHRERGEREGGREDSLQRSFT